MSDREFEALRALVRRETGISLGPHKRTLLEARLGKRLRALQLTSFGAYHALLEHDDPDGEERRRFVNAVTTNETSFFREAQHFAYLTTEWLPARRALAARTGERRIRIWSAACSSGEEPYSIAMTFAGELPDLSHWDLRILASDIDTDVLRRAAQGVYPTEALGTVPPTWIRRFFLRGIGAHSGTVRIRPEVAALVTFRRLNLFGEAWPIRTRFDLLFCRNVLMYFDRASQGTLVGRLERMLAPTGLLVLGHAESLLGLETNLERVTGTIYRRAGTAPTG
jgi:chemotaxis protein methyltransferase CheR